ncbi:tetratricopeptide repeat-containing sensor histidine kinase [Chitinophagaceae bacterium MMS25-I14]
MVFYFPAFLQKTAAQSNRGVRANDTISIYYDLATAARQEQTAPDSAIAVYRNTLNRSLNIGYTNGVLKSYRKIADDYYKNGFFTKCRETVLTAITWCDSSATGRFYKGVFYDRAASASATEGKLSDAIQYYMKAIEIRLNLPSKIPLAVTYGNLGVLFNNFNQPRQALYYLDLAENIYKRQPSENLTSVFYNQSISYEELDDSVNNIARLKMAILLSRKLNDYSVLVPALDRLGMQYMKAGKNAEAISYCEEALAINGDIDLTNKIAPYYTLGYAYMRLHNFNESEKYLQKYLAIAEPLRMMREIAEGHLSLAILYDSMGKAAPALKHMETYLLLHDSLNNEDLKQSVNQLEVKYRTAQKEKAIKEKQLQIADQKDIIHRKNQLLFFTVSVLLLLLSVSIIIQQRTRYKRRSQEQQISRLVQEQKYVKLQAQAHGEEAERSRMAREIHDGFGTLLTSAGLTLNLMQKDFPDLAENAHYNALKEIIAATSKGLRDTARNLLPDYVLRYPLPKAVQLFCDSVKKHHEPQFNIQSFGDFSLIDQKPEIKLNCYRIIQELISNIIKHSAATVALIDMTVNDDMFFITAEDNGKGFNPANREVGAGIGLDSIKSRTGIMNGTVEVESQPGTGTTVRIEVPLGK